MLITARHARNFAATFSLPQKLTTFVNKSHQKRNKSKDVHKVKRKNQRQKRQNHRYNFEKY